MGTEYDLTPVDEITPLYAIEFLTEAARQRAMSLVLPAERREATAAQVLACRAALDAELAELRAIRDRARRVVADDGRGTVTRAACHILGEL